MRIACGFFFSIKSSVNKKKLIQNIFNDFKRAIERKIFKFSDNDK